MSEKTIAIAIWDGAEELDVVGPYEVLAAWGGAGDGRNARVFTVADRADVVRLAHGLRVVPDATWEDVEQLDVVLLPGGNARRQTEDEAMLGRLRRLSDGGTLMTSVCTGAQVLAAAGLLDGRPATTHWSAVESLGSFGENIEVRPDDRFVDSGSVVTAAGVSAGIDMALHLVARLDSVERAREVRRYIQYDPEPPV